MLLKSLKSKNYVSFNSEAQEIGDFNNLNILIGRNNQGKINLLKGIQFLDYNYLISYLQNIPDKDVKLKEHPHVTIQSNREFLSIFHHPYEHIPSLEEARALMRV